MKIDNLTVASEDHAHKRTDLQTSLKSGANARDRSWWLHVVYAFFFPVQTAMSFWLYNGFQPGEKGWQRNPLFDRFNPLLGEAKQPETLVNKDVGEKLSETLRPIV